MGIIGARVVRTEDPRLLTTGGTYTEDLRDEALAGALHLSFVRSPLAHARVLGIDTSAARAAAGVVAVVTASDLAGLAPIRPMAPFLNQHMLRPLLAAETVRYVGEPVAAVVTTHPQGGEDAAELVDVDYEGLPAVVGPRAAARDEVLLFAAAGTNTVATFGTAPPEGPDPLFDGCEVVVTRQLVNQRLAPAPLEVRAGAAAVGADGRLTVWLPNQGAQHARAAIARMLGIPAEQVRVVTPDVGGGFGAKYGADPEIAVLGWIARTLGRPVRWVETRSENLVGMTHGRAQEQTVTIGGSRDGRVLAYRLDLIQDCGAYPALGAVLPELTRMMAPGVYDIARVASSARSVVSSATPVGAYRGAGRPEATSAIERAMDLFAAELGLDPAQVRRRNLLPAFDRPLTTVTGATYDCGDYPAALDRVLAAAGYEQLRAQQAQRRAAADPVQLGIGVCVYVEITGAGVEAGAPRRTPPSRFTPTAASPSSPAPLPTGRGTPRPGRCWQRRSSASRWNGSPCCTGTPTWCRGEGAPPAPAACSRAVQRSSRPLASWSRSPAGAPRTCSRRTWRIWCSTPRGRRWWSVALRVPGSRWPTSPGASRCRCTPSSPLPVRPSRSARTSRSSRWTPSRARSRCAAW